MTKSIIASIFLLLPAQGWSSENRVFFDVEQKQTSYEHQRPSNGEEQILLNILGATCQKKYGCKQTFDSRDPWLASDVK